MKIEQTMTEIQADGTLSAEFCDFVFADMAASRCARFQGQLLNILPPNPLQFSATT